MSTDPWTAAEDARLRELAVAGLSASRIARELPGRTRNAIIGRMARLKPPLPDLPQKRGAWTPEVVEQLKALVAEGLTFSLIAEQLGLSRGSCINKAERLGLRRGEAAKHPPGPRRKPGQPWPRPDTAREPQRATVRAAEPEEPMPAAKSIAMPQRPIRCEGVPIWELRPEHCRYIVVEGDVHATRYCGKHTTGEKSAWCPHHRGIVYSRVPAPHPALVRASGRRVA